MTGIRNLLLAFVAALGCAAFASPVKAQAAPAVVPVSVPQGEAAATHDAPSEWLAGQQAQPAQGLAAQAGSRPSGTDRSAPWLRPP